MNRRDRAAERHAKGSLEEHAGAVNPWRHQNAVVRLILIYDIRAREIGKCWESKQR
jgi:hypothetical protein